MVSAHTRVRRDLGRLQAYSTGQLPEVRKARWLNSKNREALEGGTTDKKSVFHMLTVMSSFQQFSLRANHIVQSSTRVMLEQSRLTLVDPLLNALKTS